MSTILDALRKLQGDRDGMQAPTRDLRTSVLDGGSALPPLRTKRREPSVRPLIAALGGGALVAGGIGLFILWSDREADPFERATADAELPADAPQMAQAEMPYDAPADIAPPPPPQSDPLVNMAAPPEPPPTPAPQYVPPVFDPTVAHGDPDPPAPSSQPWFTPPETFAPVLERARPRNDADPSQALPGSQPGFAPPPKYDPPQVVTRTQGQDSTEPAALEAAVARARERLNAREPEPEPRRARSAPREEPPPREAAPNEVSAVPLASGLQFPDLSVQSVLWHPDPLRRQATVMLDGQLTTDAREGDLIGGVFIDRIQPGSVEFRMGQERKRVDISP